MALADIIEQIKAWPLKRKVAAVAIVLLSFALMAGIMLWSQRIDYQILYTNLTPEDAGQVIAKLKEMKVPYKVEGNIIYVPSNRVYELRLELAAQGIPQGGGIGFEIFDRTQIGITEFVQRLNYIRALQGELVRTVRQLSEVEQARVHIAIPERTIFTEKEDKPSASVVLKLKHGRFLNQDQIGGIVHLISSSVEGMQPQNVTIIDNMGNLLSKPAHGDIIADAKQREYQRSVDKDYENKLQSMLEGIVGRGKAIVRISTKIDFTQVEKTEEKFDPDTIAVRSEQRVQEKSTMTTTGGIPGVLSNQPGQPPLVVSPSSSQKQSEDINYEISRTVSRIIQPRGEVKNISVAVLVDGTYKKEKDKKVYVPRDESEMKKYRDIIMAAIGYNKDRGDQVIVENVPFEVDIEELPPAEIDYMRIAMSLLKYLIPLVVVALLIIFVIKPIIEILKAPVLGKIPEEAKITVTPGVTAPPVTPEATPDEVMKEEVMGIIKKEPRRAAMLLKEWMSE